MGDLHPGGLFSGDTLKGFRERLRGDGLDRWCCIAVSEILGQVQWPA